MEVKQMFQHINDFLWNHLPFALDISKSNPEFFSLRYFSINIPESSSLIDTVNLKMRSVPLQTITKL